jgi:protein-disulfide isomerase
MTMKTTLILKIVFSSCCVISAAENGGGPKSPGGEVVLDISGKRLTRSDLERKNAARLFQARNSFYETERKAVEEFIDEYLLEQEAQKQNLTVTQLLEKTTNSSLQKDPSEEALRVYFEGIDTAEPFEAVRDKITEHLRQRRAAKAKSALIQSLRSKENITIRLAPPRAGISLKDTPVRGLPDAPVTIIEYADYECPYCQQIQPALNQLESEFKGKLAFAYKDVPLPMHSNAQKAAEATHCAGVQGKYWELHDVLANSKQLDLPALKKGARELNLDGAAFDKCLDSGEKAGIVKTHMSEAQTLGLQGTPSFFINGRFFSGALTIEKLREIVNEELGIFAEKQKTAANVNK